LNNGVADYQYSKDSALADRLNQSHGTPNSIGDKFVSIDEAQ